MTNESTRQGRRELLCRARMVADAPERHSPNEVWEACDVMIRFGSIVDMATANRLAEAISAGDVKPGSALDRRRVLIRMAAIAAVVVWVIAWTIGAVADAQSDGRLPSIAEMIQ